MLKQLNHFKRKTSDFLDRIIVPTARQSVSQGQNGNEDQFFFREKVSLSEVVGKKDRLSNRASGIVCPSKARLDSPSEWSLSKGKSFPKEGKSV